MSRKLLSLLTIFALVIICALYGKKLDRWGQNQIIQNDAISYYAYLPATFIFGDLNFGFTKELPENFEGKIWLQTAPNGKPILRMTMGLAILWIPFFLFAHLFALITGISALGYSWPYSFSVFAAALFYLFAGCFFLRKILSRYFSDLTTSVVLILIVMATNLIYYVISEPGMSHVYNFALITAFLYYSMEWTENPSSKYSVILGLLTGLIVLIRPTNMLVLIFPALTGIQSFSTLRNRIVKNWRLILLAGLMALLVLIPQMVYWKLQTGHFIFNSYLEQGKFYFGKPQIINGLFSYRKGWLVYTPVMIFSFAGLVFLKKKAPNLFYPVLLFCFINMYVVYSWWCWWYGGSFGSRPMIDTYGVMAIPLAALIHRIFKREFWIKGVAVVLLAGLVYLNQFQMKQYQTSLLHWDSMTKKAYWGILFHKHWPANYADLIKIPDYDRALKGEKEYP
jgi:hypothetical protein